ncbi:MAG: class I SAM-dependent methyltransferase [Ignavibacteriae bacterium]|nr:class I SAM-dependent methyltransferase [Ignavibacteriota bacterium]
MEISRCRICDAQQLRQIPFGYNFNSKWFSALECNECGIIFLDPQPTADEFKQMYSHEYFEGDFRCGHAGSYFDDAVTESLEDNSLLQRFRKLKPAGKFLEVGCAGGAFLNAAKKVGYEVYGVEFSNDAAELARTKYGLEVVVGDVHDAKFPDNMFDVIFLGDVLEHLPNPLASVKELHRILAPKGVVIFECPTQTNTIFSRVGFLLYSMLNKRATVNMPPYHVFEYRPNSMTNLINKCGLRVIETNISIIPPKEISMRGSALENIGKKLFHYINNSVTKMVSLYGDRIEIIATKE